MRISISLKWTLSAVLIVIVVVCVYAFFTIRETRESVLQETSRIQTMQVEALDQIGAQTTRYISLPASSLLFDNDRSGLSGLLSPIVEEDGNKKYFAVYTTLIAPNGRVWVGAVNRGYDRLSLAESEFFDRNREKEFSEEVSTSWLEKTIKGKSFPMTEELEREVVLSGGEKKTISVRQYTHEIKGNGEVQGYLMIGYSLDEMNREIEAIRAQGEVRSQDAKNQAVWLALIAVIIGLFVSGLQALFVTRNIKKLSKAANQIASGDLAVRSDVRSHDEIGQLGEQFNLMADRVQALMVETEQKAMLEKEVDIARSIQTTLLPACGYAECGPVRLNGYFRPASECGGDFWSYNRLSDGSVLLTIGDVTGHGVPSAMITACAKSALDTMLNLTHAQGLSLSQVVTSLNAAICQAAKRTLFMTFQAMRVSADGRVAELVNAGHNFPLLLHNGEVKGVVARGERLGDNEQARYDSVRVELSRGDMILFYTDGLTEYQNEQGAEYGEKRLRKVIAPCGGMHVNDAMGYLQQDFESFCGNAVQADDITMMFASV